MASVDKNAGVIIARMVSASGELDKAAEKVVQRARQNAAGHTKTGHYSSSFGTAKVPGKKGVVDTVAYNDDPAAMSIEFGHYTKGGKFVPGKFNLTRAAQE